MKHGTLALFYKILTSLWYGSFICLNGSGYTSKLSLDPDPWQTFLRSWIWIRWKLYGSAALFLPLRLIILCLFNSYSVCLFSCLLPALYLYISQSCSLFPHPSCSTVCLSNTPPPPNKLCSLPSSCKNTHQMDPFPPPFCTKFANFLQLGNQTLDTNYLELREQCSSPTLPLVKEHKMSPWGF